ncbi:MAG: pyruvate kinase [Gaiella sp.]
MAGHKRRTKIVATIGPATSSRESIQALVAAGMDCARLNMSHGTQDDAARRLALVREIEAESGRAIAVMADLRGPKLRVGDLDAPLELRRDAEVFVSTRQAAQVGDLVVQPAAIGDALQVGHDILIDDGRIRLRVNELSGGRARCTVIAGGTVTSQKGVNLPGIQLPIPSLTDKDREDLEWALGAGVDYVALSFVRSADDVRELRAIVEASGSNVWIVSKIEKAEAVAALDEILTVTDAVMVARGDLGVEIGVAEVPLVQKRIISAALESRKPVITATQMLETMISSPEPTRAEASDVANAILDGTSALMLSGETAVGEYPVEAVTMMDRIALAIEPAMSYRHEIPSASDEPTIGQAMSNAACDIAEALEARALIVPTSSGRTALAVARLRPRRAIAALSHNQDALRHLALEWGVTPLLLPETHDVEDLWGRAVAITRESGIVDAGDRVVITAGTQVNIPGSTNVIKVDIA